MLLLRYTHKYLWAYTRWFYERTSMKYYCFLLFITKCFSVHQNNEYYFLMSTIQWLHLHLNCNIFTRVSWQIYTFSSQAWSNHQCLSTMLLCTTVHMHVGTKTIYALRTAWLVIIDCLYILDDAGWQLQDTNMWSSRTLFGWCPCEVMRHIPWNPFFMRLTAHHSL